MSDFELNLNEQQVLNAVSEAFRDANELFGRHATEEITANKWEWPNGQSPRDIVDQNGLRGSYKPTPGGDEYEHAWTQEYAAAVHSGARFRAESKWGRIWTNIWGKPEMPGRPWTEEPLEQLPKDFETLANAKLERL